MSEAKRLRALEDENSKLKRMLADAILDRLIHNAHRLELSGDSLRRSAPRSQA